MQQTHHGLFLNCAVRWRSGGDLFTRHISLQNGVDNPIFSADFSVQRQSAGFGGQRGRPGAAGVRNQGPDNNSESSRSPQVKARPRPLGLVNNSPAVLSHRVLCLRISQASMKVLRAFSTFPWSPCDAWASATSAACHRRLLPFAYSPPRPLSSPAPSETFGADPCLPHRYWTVMTREVEGTLVEGWAWRGGQLSWSHLIWFWHCQVLWLCWWQQNMCYLNSVLLFSAPVHIPLTRFLSFPFTISSSLSLSLSPLSLSFCLSLSHRTFYSPSFLVSKISYSPALNHVYTGAFFFFFALCLHRCLSEACKELQMKLIPC